MPTISRFQGIEIRMFSREHGVPHFHAVYGGFSAQIAIATIEPISGSLPPKQLRLVRQWGRLHKRELEENWERASRHLPLVSIEPLP